MIDRARRAELAKFLQNRRSRLSPAEFGIEPRPRRRAKGLRREEVAERAGISVAWYACLEQARDVRVSANTLSWLAQTLRLDPDERWYMFELLGLTDPGRGTSVREESLRPEYSRLLESLDRVPAYIDDYKWDILGWNDAAGAIYRLSDVPVRDRNTLFYMFLNPYARELIPAWEQEAKYMLARFRMAVAPYAGTEGVNAVIERLRRESREFVRWWADHNILVRRSGRKELRHRRFGKLVFEYCSLQLSDESSKRLVLYNPVDEADTKGKLSDLLADYHRERPRTSYTKELRLGMRASGDEALHLEGRPAASFPTNDEHERRGMIHDRAFERANR
ncbi:helix-turn-helix transcriptional regulator [Pendulispora albinea]|uniref:Helix-turn-helix transcriptional regulator n=1 Tax=Pendulispora albinea TaxID=2741071 RepID=A0ABZ2LM27_9BACT